MALPMPLPSRSAMLSPSGSASPGDLARDDAPLRSSSPTCSLTIFKATTCSQISAHTPVASKSPAGPQPAGRGGRFAGSFASLAQPQRSNDDPANHEAVSVHAVHDDSILLPFINRPREVEELLFATKSNEQLLMRLCRVFGGSQHEPTGRGHSEAWDELLEILLGVDRAILDDEDWLLRLEAIIMDRSAELWAQVQRCLGADGLLRPHTSHADVARYDSWADSSALSDNESTASATSPSTPIFDAQGPSSKADAEAGIAVDVHTLHELPSSFYKQTIGQMRRASIYESVSTGGGKADATGLDSNDDARDHRASLPSSTGHFGEPLADIVEEPSKASGATLDAPSSRNRSYSGRFAGLRIHATPHAAAQSPAALSPLSREGRGLDPASPLPTGAMSPLVTDTRRASISTDESVSTSGRTTFFRPRRLSMLVGSGSGSGSGAGDGPRSRSQSHSNHHVAHQQHHNREVKDKALRVGHSHVRETSLSPHRSPSAAKQHDGTGPSRRRAMSFARSFAQLHPAEAGQLSSTTHVEIGRSTSPKRPAVRHRKSHSVSSGDAASTLGSAEGPPHGLGLLPDGRTQHPSATTLGRSRALSMATPKMSHSLSAPSNENKGRALSEKGDTSPSIPGLLPDGRTRHPSGSLGSKDLSESIAAFRATMGLSASPSGGARREIKEEAAPLEGSKTTTTATKPTRAKSPAKRSSPPLKASKAAESNSDAPAPEPDAPRRQGPSGGSGLALGGGFSLAKSGANFKRASADSTQGRSPTGGDQISPTSVRGGSRSHRADYFHFHSPPPVHRRPGGFASLANEWHSAKRSRRATSGSIGSAFSIQSNAVASSPGSSVASLDADGPPSIRADLYHEGDERNQPISPVSRIQEWSGRKPSSSATDAMRTPMPESRTTAPSSSATPGGHSTPRASMSGHVDFKPPAPASQYPFPPTAASSATGLSSFSAARGAPTSPRPGLLSPSISGAGVTGGSSASQHKPMPQHLAPSSHAVCFAPRSPSLVFPISSDNTVSRAQELEKKLASDQGESARRQVIAVVGDEGWKDIRSLIASTERRDLPDEALLEAIGKKLRLVDHEEALKAGGRKQDEADAILAEEGYEQRWEAFAALCGALGVGAFEISLAKKRCGPAIELVCGSGSGSG